MRRYFLGLAALLLLHFPIASFAASSDATSQLSREAGGDDAGREFISSCTYGVLAGTLVGLASLAFTKDPGHNLSHVARGASIGLYAGILLGLYVVYVVPGMD